MKKGLLFFVSLTMVLGTNAQIKRKVAQTTDYIKSVQVAQAPVAYTGTTLGAVGKFTPGSVAKGFVPNRISKVSSTGIPEFSLKRPGGVLWGGMCADVAASSYPYSLIALPAFTPLTFSLMPDKNIPVEGDTYYVSVPFWDAETNAVDEKYSSGEDVTSSFLPSLGSYSSPFASVLYNNAEYGYYMSPDRQYTDRNGVTQNLPGLVSVGIGGLPAGEDGIGAQTLGNYSATWDGDPMYLKAYAATNTSLSGWDSRFEEYGSDFRMSTIIELFDAPVASFYVTGISLNAVVSSETCGRVHADLVSTYTDENGYLRFGKILASGVCDGPTDTYSTWSVFAFKNLKDTENNDLEGVVVPAGQGYALMFYLDEDDTTTQLFPFAQFHSDYLEGEDHAYLELGYLPTGTTERDWIVTAPGLYYTAEETRYYMTSWMCGLTAEYPYLHLLTAEDGYVGEGDNSDSYCAGLEGGSAKFAVASDYVLVDEEYEGERIKTVDVTLANGEPLPDWITVEYENYFSTDTESGEQYFTGEVVIRVTVAPGSDDRYEHIKFTNKSATLTLGIGRAADPTGITDITSDTQTNSKLAGKFNMSGQRVNDSYRGLVIKDGKKYIKK